MSTRKGILNFKNNSFMNSIFHVLYTTPEFCLMISKFSENLDKNSYTSQLSSLITQIYLIKYCSGLHHKLFLIFKYSKHSLNKMREIF